MTQNLSGPTPETPTPPNLSALAARVEALQQEISALKALLTLREPLEQPATSALLARRNPERLNAEVMRRSARVVDPDNDTDLDLLIDRLHELSEESP
jgi:hypothetical protein